MLLFVVIPLSSTQSVVFIILLLLLVSYVYAIMGVIIFQSYTASTRQDLLFHGCFRCIDRVRALYHSPNGFLIYIASSSSCSTAVWVALFFMCPSRLMLMAATGAQLGLSLLKFAPHPYSSHSMDIGCSLVDTLITRDAHTEGTHTKSSSLGLHVLTYTFRWT